MSDPAGTRQHAGPMTPADLAELRAWCQEQQRIGHLDADNTLSNLLAAHDALRARLASLEAERQAVAELVAAAVAYARAWAEEERCENIIQGDGSQEAHDAWVYAMRAEEGTRDRLLDKAIAYAARAGQGGEGA